jgi:acyl carrier protein
LRTVFADDGQQQNAGMIELREHIPYMPAYVEPRTPVEQKLAAIWEKVLGVDRVGMADRFDYLGGNSLLAAIIFSDIEKSFSIKIPMATLLQAPTIELLAQKVQGLIDLKG